MSDSPNLLKPEEHSGEQQLDAMARVLNSKTFAEVSRLRKFLEYSVRETVAGRKDRLKGFVIACDVFGKEDPSDAQTTTVVRVEAGRLRRRLKDYYEFEGKKDPLRISIPKGGYSALFTPATKALENNRPPAIQETRNSWRHPALLVFVAALVLLVYLAPWRQSASTPPASEVISEGRPTIAVLPFTNLTGDHEGTSLSIGLAEDIVIELGRLSSLDVIFFSSVLQYSDQELSPQKIGAELGAGYVLKGSIRLSPPDLRVTASLYETESGRQLWAERFDRQVGDELALQEELARKVVVSLSIGLHEEDINSFGNHFTENKEAWHLYKQAMNLVNPPSEPARLSLAQHVFEQVIEMDPAFAGGYAGGAYTRAFKLFFGHSEVPYADREASMELATRARKIDPSFGLTFSALAFIYLSERDFDRAYEMSSQAIEMQPNDPYVAAYHGFIMATRGNLDGGIEFVNRALRLDPFNARSPYLNILGVIHYLAGHYDEALNALLKNQNRGGPQGAGPLRFLAASHSKLGESGQAELALKAADQQSQGQHDWETWLLNAFRDPALPHKVIDEVRSIRASAQMAE